MTLRKFSLLNKLFTPLVFLCFGLFLFAFNIPPLYAQTPIKAKASVQGTTITVSWEEVPGMSFYKVYDASGTLYDGGNVGSQTRFVFHGKPDTGYIFKIRGYKTGETTYSAAGEVSATTSSDSTSSGSATSGSASSGSSGSTSSGSPPSGSTSSSSTSSGSATSTSSSGAGETSIQIGAPFPGEASNVTFSEHLQNAFNWAATIGSLLAVFMIVFAGFKYMTSTGNPEALQDAKDTISGAVIGLAMLILIYFLLEFFGVKNV